MFTGIDSQIYSLTPILFDDKRRQLPCTAMELFRRMVRPPFNEHSGKRCWTAPRKDSLLLMAMYRRIAEAVMAANGRPEIDWTTTVGLKEFPKHVERSTMSMADVVIYDDSTVIEPTHKHGLPDWDHVPRGFLDFMVCAAPPVVMKTSNECLRATGKHWQVIANSFTAWTAFNTVQSETIDVRVAQSDSKRVVNASVLNIYYQSYAFITNFADALKANWRIGVNRSSKFPLGVSRALFPDCSIRELKAIRAASFRG